MPNHVENKLTVLGTSEKINKFVASVRAAPLTTKEDEASFNYRDELPDPLPFSFNELVPLPEEYTQKSYNDYGYYIERETWGVKWGGYDQDEPIVFDGQATYKFTTAWSPPTILLEKASPNFPALTFVLSWGGEGPTRGEFVIKNGEVLHNLYNPLEPLFPEYDEELAENEDPTYESEWFEKYSLVERHYLSAHDDLIEMFKDK